MIEAHIYPLGINSGNAKNLESRHGDTGMLIAFQYHHNTESRFLAKPYRASFQVLIFVVMSLVKGVPFPARHA